MARLSRKFRPQRGMGARQGGLWRIVSLAQIPTTSAPNPTAPFPMSGPTDPRRPSISAVGTSGSLLQLSITEIELWAQMRRDSICAPRHIHFPDALGAFPLSASPAPRIRVIPFPPPPAASPPNPVSSRTPPSPRPPPFSSFSSAPSLFVADAAAADAVALVRNRARQCLEFVS